MDTSQLMDLLPIVIGMVVVALGLMAKIKAVVKEFQDVINTIAEALADDKIDNAEIKNIVKESKDIVPALKALISKK